MTEVQQAHTLIDIRSKRNSLGSTDIASMIQVWPMSDTNSCNFEYNPNKEWWNISQRDWCRLAELQYDLMMRWWPIPFSCRQLPQACRTRRSLSYSWSTHHWIKSDNDPEMSKIKGTDSWQELTPKTLIFGAQSDVEPRYIQGHKGCLWQHQESLFSTAKIANINVSNKYMCI